VKGQCTLNPIEGINSTISGKSKMKCIECDTVLIARFCHNCGAESYTKGKEHINLPKEPYNKVWGLWKVTTEGDVEGKTIKDLGIHKGFIDVIASNLAPSCFYSLRFTSVDVNEYPEYKACKSVEVSLDHKSGLWDVKPSERVKIVSKIFEDAGRSVKIEEGRYYASVKIIFDDD
jgi:hypothetical protein